MNSEPNRCIGIFGQWFGHRFRPRWDTEERIAGCAEAILSTAPQKTNLGQVVGALTGNERMQDILEQLREERSTYVCDICVRCGAVRQRESFRPTAS